MSTPPSNTATRKPFFAHSAWDAVPVVAGILHFAAIIGFFLAFPYMPWWAVILCGLVYAVSISWNVNGVSHNFIHNPYFTNPALNRAYSILISLTLAFSQVMYHWVHMRHHSGNMDRPDAKGDTVDLISIYRHGRNGEAEGMLKYVALAYFRDDPPLIYRSIKRTRPAEAYWGLAEVALVVLFYGGMTVLNWKFVVCVLPFYYLGHSLSALNGYYEHLAGDPDEPLAWGVSNYGWLYNATWFNNGYHAEHHYRPKQHWTRMEALRQQTWAQQQAAGVKVLSWPHILGFLDHTSRQAERRRKQQARAA